MGKNYNLDLRFVHYWKFELSSEDMDNLLDHYKLHSKSIWLILLDEKLRRNELEISI